MCTCIPGRRLQVHICIFIVLQHFMRMESVIVEGDRKQEWRQLRNVTEKFRIKGES